MANKRSGGRPGGNGRGGKGGAGGGGKTAETAVITRFRGWYRAHLKDTTLANEHTEHLGVDEAVEIVTDLFAMSRDIRPQGSFARPDAELLDKIFTTVEADIDLEGDEADVDDTLFTIADIIEHYLDFLVDTELWHGTDEQFEACMLVLDELLDLPESFIDTVVEDLVMVDPTPVGVQLEALAKTTMLSAAAGLAGLLVARADGFATRSEALAALAESGVTAPTGPFLDPWWTALAQARIVAPGLSVGEAPVLAGDSAAEWLEATGAAALTLRQDLVARIVLAWAAGLRTGEGSAAPSVSSRFADSELSSGELTTIVSDAVIARVAIAAYAEIHGTLVVGELVEELLLDLVGDDDEDESDDRTDPLDALTDEREWAIGEAERVLDALVDDGLLLPAPEFGYVIAPGVAGTLCGALVASQRVLSALELSAITPPSSTAVAPARVLTVKVAIVGTKPAVWRRLEVSSEASFRDLHLAIQLSLGWTDSAAHYFSAADGDDTVIIGAGDGADELGERVDLGDGLVEESEALLSVALVEAGDELSYVYDLDDEWWHVVRLESSVPAPLAPKTGPLPRCTDARGAAPLDRSGGPAGWAETLAALADPAHPDHASAREALRLADGDTFDPAAVDVATVDRALTVLREV